MGLGEGGRKRAAAMWYLVGLPSYKNLRDGLKELMARKQKWSPEVEEVSSDGIPLRAQGKRQKLSPQQLQKLYNKKLEEGYAPQTVKHIHRVLHRALRDALRWNLVARNVCDAVDAPRVPKQEMKALSGEQAQHFLAVAKDDPLEALYVLALTTGMRERELLGLKWEDVDFARKKVQVRRTISRVPHQGFKVAEPKTQKSRRSIHMTDRARQSEALLSAGPLWNEQG